MTPHDHALPKEEADPDIAVKLRCRATAADIADLMDDGVNKRRLLFNRQIDLDAAAEIERLRTALRAVRASTDPKWQAQIISDALRETEI